MLNSYDTVFISHVYISISKKGRKHTYIIILQTPLAIALHKYIQTCLMMHLLLTFQSFLNTRFFNNFDSERLAIIHNDL